MINPRFCKALLVMTLAFGASSALASRGEMVNKALSDSLKERSEVERVYGSNSAATRLEESQSARRSRRIEIEVGGELGGGRGRKSDLRPTVGAEPKAIRENVVRRLDRELIEINRAMDRNDARPERMGRGS